jgi:hypothetical protein
VRELAYYVDRAEAGDFCGGDIFELRDRDASIPSRVLKRGDAEPGVRK